MESQSKALSLEQDHIILTEKFNEEKSGYFENLKRFRDEIQRLKISNTYDSVNNKEQFTELADLKKQLASNKQSLTSAMSFIVEVFRTIVLLPEKIEVDQATHNLAEFSFEQRDTIETPKDLFL